MGEHKQQVSQLTQLNQQLLKKGKEDAERRETQFKNDLADLERTFNQHRSAMSAQYQSDLLERDNRHNAEVADLKARNRAHLNSLEAQHNTTVQTMQKRH